MQLLRALAVLSFLFSFTQLQTGCAGKGVEGDNPEEMYKDAMDDLESERFQAALEKLRTVKNKFPYSKYSVMAQLSIADLFFAQETFPEAASSYELFRELHPKHEKAPYALYRAGESYFLDIPGNRARDISSAYKSLDAFNEFSGKYPSDPQAADARKRVKEVREIIAEKEFTIARFYQKRDKWDAAKSRFQKVVDLYPETQFAEKAKDRLRDIDDEQKPE